jgi:hypothetical protein
VLVADIGGVIPLHLWGVVLADLCIVLKFVLDV